MPYIGKTPNDLADLSIDTTPKLGGDLDLNGKNITGTGDIPAANLTGALPAISGASLTSLPADATKLPLAGGALTGAVTTNSTFDGRDVAADGATADAALPKAGGAMTGAITTNSTFDGVDIAVRDAVLTSTTTTAGAALPKAGGVMTGTTTLKGITETEASHKTASFVVYLSEGTIFELTGSNNITVTMPAVAAGKAFTVINSSTGTLGWGTSPVIKWASDTVPTDSGISIYSFISNGAFWYGMQAGSAFTA